MLLSYRPTHQSLLLKAPARINDIGTRNVNGELHWSERRAHHRLGKKTGERRPGSHARGQASIFTLAAPRGTSLSHQCT